MSILSVDGTTDITRTVHFGTPSEREKDAFTRVLKGFISVSTAIFPPYAPVCYIIRFHNFLLTYQIIYIHVLFIFHH